jgi:golgi phosphoprotein 3
MTTESDLALHEQLLLLALHDEKGTMHTWLFAYAAAAAILVELIDRGKLGVEHVKAQAILNAAETSPTGQALLDDVLRQVANLPRPLPVESWITSIAASAGLQDRIADALCQRGILARSEGRVLWVFSRKTYPTADAAPEKALVAALAAELTGTAPLTAHGSVLLALAHETNILAHVFDSAQLAAHRDRINQAMKLDTLAPAQQDVVRAAVAAIANVRTAAIAGAM